MFLPASSRTFEMFDWSPYDDKNCWWSVRPLVIPGVVRLWSLLKFVVRVWNFSHVPDYFFPENPWNLRFLFALQISSWSIGRDNTEKFLTITREFFLFLKKQDVSLKKFFFYNIFSLWRNVHVPSSFLFTMCPFVCLSAVQKFTSN